MRKLTSILLFLALAACSTMKVIDVADYQKEGRENLVSVNHGLEIITNDLSGLNGVALKWSDAQSKKMLNKLNQSKQNIQQNFVRTREDFENSKFKNRSRVTGEDKDFQLVKDERDDFQTRFQSLDDQLKQYRADRNAYKEYLESKGIYRVDAKRINTDFITALNESKRTQLKVKNELMDYNVKLNQAVVSPELAKQNKTTIQELVKIVEKIENETFRLQRQHSIMAQEIGQSVVYVTPGMKAHGYVQKIKLQGETVTKLVEEFNTLAQTLQF